MGEAVEDALSTATGQRPFATPLLGRSGMNREEATEMILEAKKEKGLTYAAIAEKVGAHKAGPRQPCWASAR